MQTVSLIVDPLIEDGLLARDPGMRAHRSAVGADFAACGRARFPSACVKVGRRSLDVLSMDFAGTVRMRETLDYAYPDPHPLIVD